MRIPGFEPEQVAWEATIITTRSYPQKLFYQMLFVLLKSVILETVSNNK